MHVKLTYLGSNFWYEFKLTVLTCATCLCFSNSGRKMKFHFGASFQWIYQRQQCPHIPPGHFPQNWVKPDIFWDCKSYPNFLGRTETISSALTISCRQKRELDFLFQFSLYWRLSCSKGDWGFNTKGEFLRNSTRTSESSSTTK